MFSIQLMCQVLGVTRSSYYAWRHNQYDHRALSTHPLMEKIRLIFESSRRTYGTRRIKHELSKQGEQVSRRRIGKLMAELGLTCRTKKRFKVTTDSRHSLPIAPNRLARCFEADAPNQVYVSDITSIWTQQGWLYLAVVIDLFSRKVVGWSIQDHMKADLVNHALLMAIRHRQPPKGLISHSDRGSQYAAHSHRTLLSTYGMLQSMSRKGNCWDNAVAESFFHTLKTELIYGRALITKEETKKIIFEYIEVFYNRTRLHSANDYLSPVEYEEVVNF